MVALADIVAARDRIADGVAVTPCPYSSRLSELTGCTIFCKLDYLHPTGSFKERGARNALLLLDGASRSRGVIAASAGNHALALCYHGRDLAAPVTVVMPEFAPLIKVSTCRRLGARVILEGATFNEAVDHARRLADAEGLTYVHGFDDPAIIAGAGVAGLEIIEQVSAPDAILVPVGGAGLIAGVSLAVKSLRKETQIIGVEPQRCASYAAAAQAGRPVEVAARPTLADGLAVGRVGELAFEIARRHIDRHLTVREEDIALAILRLVECEKAVVEGGGASSLAALLAGELPELAGKRVVLCLCGGNIDPGVLATVIEKGLVADGRICRFTVHISDRPGGLAQLTRLIAEAGASVREISHDRAFCGADVASVNALCLIETRDREHQAELFTRLTAAGLRFHLHGEELFE